MCRTDACRWLEYADTWGLAKLEACCLDFIKTKCSGPSGDNAHGAGDVGPNQTRDVISFMALLRSGRKHAGLEKLSPAVLAKLVEAALMAPVHQSCMTRVSDGNSRPATGSRSVVNSNRRKTVSPVQRLKQGAFYLGGCLLVSTVLVLQCAYISGAVIGSCLGLPMYDPEPWPWQMVPW
jgi:hypothetical protein